MDELEAQLCQMKAALQIAAEEDKPALESIIKDLEELVNPVVGASFSAPAVLDVATEVEEQDEYSIFQAEIAALDTLDVDSETTNTSSNGQCSSSSQSNMGPEIRTKSVSISDELAALEGMKCLAPHEESWGQIGYYPAMISQVVSGNSGSENDFDGDDTGIDSMDSIKARVVFLQPVVRSQLFCPFFKSDRCRFSDDDCKYSHGEIVPLSSLREYSDPDYTKIVPDARVLAKYSDDLWYKATIIRLTNDGNCEVQYDKDDEPFELSMHETAPLHNDTKDSSDSESEKDECQTNSNLNTTALYDDEQIMTLSATEALGDWEKYTKGFGSKLMIKMGYVMGSGLGKKAEGRINPVDAVIVPLGMSLDKYMEMKEKVGGGNQNWFSVEKRLKKAQKRHADKEKQLTHKKNKQKPSMFEFINSHLGLRKNAKPSKIIEEKIHKESQLNLNKKMLHLGDSMNKVSKDVRKVREAMKRLEGRDATTHAVMKDKLAALEKQRNELQRMENNVAREQRQRSDKKKLVEF